MKAKDRRKEILEKLTVSQKTLSASQLAKVFDVSRQVIVGDIALLRAQGADILSTPKGYMIREIVASHYYSGRIVCKHSPEETYQELSIILEQGGQILTVEIDHPVYGMLTAPLNIKNEDDIALFLEAIKDSKGHFLSSLTEGLHSHLIACPSLTDFERIKEALSKAHILY
ncbi:transcription repressor NadR [Streptococcus iniae]|uniref:transcription repressor NadR n=1 Tax=Streptococcus iniae TaxID=1346 RepID=UPI0008D8F194|nr:transcription repressor NadR [Streptococcus iniae]OHX27775.1 transcription repressor NadR [Streptococcus iniae]RLV28279.1 transcription repressor NadR [Streptococcus iniae]